MRQGLREVKLKLRIKPPKTSEDQSWKSSAKALTQKEVCTGQGLEKSLVATAK